MMRRLEQVGIAVGVLLLTVVPTAAHGWPTTMQGNFLTLTVTAGGMALIWWRTHPRGASAASLGLFLVAPLFDGWFPDTAVALFSASFAVLALGWTGRAAWLAAACAAAYLVPFYYLTDMGSWVAALMFTVPPYLAASALRLHNETAEQL